MSVKILVNGAKGRMGQCVVQAVQAADDLVLVGEADRGDDLAAVISATQPDVVADFTVASVALTNAHIIIAAGVHPVIGTSGFLPEQIAELQAESDKQQLGGIIAPNFSLAAVLLMMSASRIAKYFPQAEIIELHHDGKQDAPSGSALRTAELIDQGRQGAINERKPCHESVAHARGADYLQTQIHAVRLPGLIAQQQVVFGGQGETLTLTHNTLSRESFMPGVLLACRKVDSLQTLAFGLEVVLEI